MKPSKEKMSANRLNAKKSTGPRTEAGKAISRRNGLKHGLTGEGVILPGEDVDAVAGRYDRLVAELKPKSELGLVMAHRISIMSVRLDRCVIHETATLTERIKQAEMLRTEERLAFVDELFDGLTTHPYTNARQLEDLPEGIDRMLDLFASVRVDLTHPTIPMYDAYRFQRLDSLMGRLPADFPASRIKALSQAMFGNLVYLREDEAVGFSNEERTAYAKAELVQIIDTQMARLRAKREFLEPRAVIHSLANASRIARVDMTPEALLVKKYEAATERSLFRSIRRVPRGRRTGQARSRGRRGY